MKVVGIRDVNFKGQDGRPVIGVQVFCTSPIERDGTGFSTDSLFFNTQKYSAPAVTIDDEIIVYYDKYGKPMHAVVVS